VLGALYVLGMLMLHLTRPQTLGGG
jgi:hypothetical protein